MSYAVMPMSDWQNILASVKAKTGKSDTLVSGSVASEIDSISGDGDAIPKYVMQEAEATIAKAKSHGNISRMIRFIAISDTHEDSANTYPTAGVSEQIAVSNRHAGQAIRYISDKIELDFIAHLGDASGCGAFSTTYSFDALCEDITRVRKNVFLSTKDVKHVFIPGNHDMMSTPGRSLLNSGAYILFGSLCSGNKDAVGGYGYFDIDDAKVRVIYLNTSDSPSSVAYLALTDAQKNWLCETLIDVNTKSNASEWKIIILSHAPLNFGGVANVSTDILIPYVNGGTYSSYSFNGKNSAKIISNVHGHVHCYSYGYLNDRIRRFTIPNACFIGNNHYGDPTKYPDFVDWTDTVTYSKTANSGKDTAFSLVTIDLDNSKCYVDNYGAGIDRAFSTDYKPIEVIVPTSISNISYSGDTTVGTAIDKSKFTFAVTYSDGTTRTVTGATSVDTATIGVVGSNPVTITYTESGVTVSGTITIEGTAKPVANLLNLNRTYVSGTMGESLANYLDESKAYTNVNYGARTFNEKSCSVSNITENSVTVTEPNVGGVTVAYPIDLSSVTTGFIRVKFDYSGAGKCRTYYSLVSSDGTVGSAPGVHIDDVAGNAGSADVRIQVWTEPKIVLYFTSNTNNTKTYTNVSVIETD